MFVLLEQVSCLELSAISTSCGSCSSKLFCVGSSTSSNAVRTMNLTKGEMWLMEIFGGGELILFTKLMNCSGSKGFVKTSAIYALRVFFIA